MVDQKGTTEHSFDINTPGGGLSIVEEVYHEVKPMHQGRLLELLQGSILNSTDGVSFAAICNLQKQHIEQVSKF